MCASQLEGCSIHSHWVNCRILFKIARGLDIKIWAISLPKNSAPRALLCPCTFQNTSKFFRFRCLLTTQLTLNWVLFDTPLLVPSNVINGKKTCFNKLISILFENLWRHELAMCSSSVNSRSTLLAFCNIFNILPQFCESKIVQSKQKIERLKAWINLLHHQRSDQDTNIAKCCLKNKTNVYTRGGQTATPEPYAALRTFARGSLSFLKNCVYIFYFYCKV